MAQSSTYAVKSSNSVKNSASGKWLSIIPTESLISMATKRLLPVSLIAFK